MLIPPNTWHSPCGVPYRWLPDGHIEVQGAGFPAWDASSAHGKQVLAIWERWGDAVQAAADKYQIPASWLVAIIKIETGGNPTLCSSAGACGLMQFMPGTCKMYGHDCSYYNDHLDEQIVDAADLLVNKKAAERGGCILSAVKGYNGGGPCSQASGINVTTPGLLNMWGENNYVEGWVRAANTFANMGLARTAQDGNVPAGVQAGVVMFVLGTVAFFFADIHWDISGRIWEALGGPAARQAVANRRR